MKKDKILKYFLSLVLFLSFSFLIPNLIPKTFAFSESVKNYDIDLTINKEGTINIKETIVYDFGEMQRHGIYRNINTIKVNEGGKRYKLKIDNLSVKDSSGNTYKFTKSKSGNSLNLKIGDPNTLITGVHTYVIDYTVSGAITYFSDHDELYWNLTGNEWDVPIENSNSIISLPNEISMDNVNVICYEGYKGSTSQNCLAGKTDSNVVVSTSRLLQSKEGLTAVVSFPKGVVKQIEPVEDRPSFLITIFRFIIGLFSFWWFLFLPFKILFKSVNEKKFVKRNQRIVSAWFEPPEYSDGTVFTPAETGFIIDKTIDHKELTATIIHLAQRGFLKIKSDGKHNFSFLKLKSEDTPDLRDFEKEVLKALFSKGGEVSDKDLKSSETFFKNISKFKKDVENETVGRKMFIDKPSSVETLNMVLFSIGIFTANFFLSFISLLFGRKSARRTLDGVEKYSEAKSLLNFLKSQDEQLNFQSKNQLFFEKLLPYAAAFGVEKIWADRFKGITVEKPDWYEGDDFTNIAFIGAMTSNIGGSMRYSMTPTSSSSGFSSGFSGGFSGGGGGGGGGGSW